MSEATQTLEAVSDTSTPIPDATLEEARSAAPPPDGAGVETPELTAAEDGEQAAPPPRTPDSYNLQELNDLYRQGKLADPQLVERREDLNRRESDRQRVEQQQLAERRAQDAQYIAYIQNLEASTKEAIKEGVNAEIEAAWRVGRTPDIELITERVGRHVSNLVEQSRSLHIGPLEHQLRQILSTVPQYATVQGQDYLGRLDIGGLVNKIWETGVEQGKVLGVGPDRVVLTKQQLEAQIKAAQETVYNRWRAENPGSAPPDGAPRSNGFGRVTYAQLQKMTKEQINALPPGTVSDVLARASAG